MCGFLLQLIKNDYAFNVAVKEPKNMLLRWDFLDAARRFSHPNATLEDEKAFVDTYGLICVKEGAFGKGYNHETETVTNSEDYGLWDH